MMPIGWIRIQTDPANDADWMDPDSDSDPQHSLPIIVDAP